MIDIKGTDGKVKITVADQSDGQNDVIITEDGKTKPYLEVAIEKEKQKKLEDKNIFTSSCKFIKLFRQSKIKSLIFRFVLTVVIVVSNPLDEMTALAQIATGFPKNRVMGQAGMLDTARFSYFVSEKTGALISEVKTLTLGSHGETMVPVPSQSSVKGKSLSQVLSKSEIDQLVDRTRNGGAEVVALLKTGSAYYAPSAAAAEMAKAVATDSNQVMPVCAWVDGEYGITGVYLGVEAQLGAKGINKVVETKLTDEELVALKTAAEAVRTKQADVKNL